MLRFLIASTIDWCSTSYILNHLLNSAFLIDIRFGIVVYYLLIIGFTHSFPLEDILITSLR